MLNASTDVSLALSPNRTLSITHYFLILNLYSGLLFRFPLQYLQYSFILKYVSYLKIRRLHTTSSGDNNVPTF